ncbi:hypothetical protein N7478_008677 [Penicillium angulare]|uniref:uncharacterized protein n=1 Tax=Penicillium angulare TaxID=116970 RepID=UPI002540C2CC|nr:uncharacterized protein N7478_008677 [Penicillium angulare]KAJ5273552.1 hypothetical protein N7478_008677 [Penicillium angulare]
MKRSTARRPHTKSRNGCQRCKARKVKCDETRPHCQNCTKHAIDCYYSEKAIGTAARSPLSAPPSATSSVEFVQSDELPSIGQGTSDPAGPGGSSVPGQNTDMAIGIAEMELLHHYSTSTCYTITRLPILQTVWRIKVPQFGFSFPFVLHGILAFSALHLAYLRPEHHAHYVDKAEFHHKQALQMVSTIMPNIDEDNAPAIYLFSSLTSLISCAKPRSADQFWMFGEKDLELLALFRGTRFIISAAGDPIKFGPLAPIFKNGSMRSSTRNSRSTMNLSYLNDLRQLLKDNVPSTEELDLYFEAIHGLGKSFAMLEEQGYQNMQTADVFVWVLELSDGYLSLLRQRKPEALVVLSYFCVITHSLEWAWWMQGLSIHMIRGIYHALDGEYHCWLQWPMEQLGWVP